MAKLGAPWPTSVKTVSAIVALAVFEGSSRNVPVSVIVTPALIPDGAVYSPVGEIVPTFGCSDHKTSCAGLASGTPSILKLNCCVATVFPPTASATLDGVMLAADWPMVTVAVPICVPEGSALSVAITWIVNLAEAKAGAVYNPVEEILPKPEPSD